MPLIPRVRSLLRNTFRGKQVEGMLREELAGYVEEQVGRRVRQGIEPAEARRQVMAEVGGVEQVKEGVRDERIGAAFNSWMRDLTVSWRGLCRRPGFTVVAVASLGLGIGANALVFSLVHTILLEPLPYPDPDRLVVVWLTPPDRPDERFGTNTGVFFTIRDNSESFEHFGTGRLNEAFTVIPRDGDLSQFIPAQFFSKDLVDTLGVEPMLGVWPEESQEVGLAISHGLWQRMYGGTPDILGTSLYTGLEGVITAVMPEGYHLMDPDTGIWAYQADDNLARALRSPNRLFTLIGRLKPDVTIGEAQAEMDRMAGVISDEFPETHEGWGLRVEPLHDAYVGGLGQSLWVFQGAVFFVLLIACANVGALVVSHAASRQRELAVRAALGSSRWRLVRQLLTDNLLLSFLGAMVGIVLAWVGARSLAASGLEGFPRLEEVSVDWAVIVFAAAVALGTGVVFGALPALHVSRPDAGAVLRDGARGGSGGPGQQRLRNAFVIGQVSLALTVLVVSALMLQSLVRVRGIGVGFDPKDLTVLELPFARTYYRNTGENTASGGFLAEIDAGFTDLSERIVEEIRTVPGVRYASATATPPLGAPAARVSIGLEGEVLSASEQTARSVEWYAVGTDYFETLKLLLVRGRTFDDRDRLEARPVAVINTTMAERFWPGEDAVGRVFRTDAIDAPEREVVGVVGDVRQDRYQPTPQPQMYVPRLQVPRRMDMARALDFLLTSVVVRTDGRVTGMEEMLRTAVREVDPTVPVSMVRTVEQYASRQLQDLRRATVLLSSFGVISVTLALVGIFGVTSHLVSQRKIELGIRIALGADRRQVLSLVLGQGAVLILVGVALGTGASLALTRLVEGMLYGVTATDPLSFAAAGGLLTAIGMVACYVPSRRAIGIDPVVALRDS